MSSFIRAERDYWQSQIETLDTHAITLPGLRVIISYELHLTMVDGKVVSALTDTASSQRCLFCGATPKDMNDLQHVRQLTTRHEHYQFGLSTLHAWIRLFECLVHIGYRKDIKKWQIRKTAEKEALQKRSAEVKQNFWERMHLHVDQPRSGGKGSSNDGNTARRAFKDEESFAAATGVDQRLIHRMHVILQTMSSGYAIDIQAFGAYCAATADLYVELYPWYPMPAAVHKVLVHAAAVVESLAIPIGMLSEDAQESRNKDVRA